MGAGSAVLVRDEALAGSDALSPAKVLAAALRRCEPDLVITATEPSARHPRTAPAPVSALPPLPPVTFAQSLAVSDPTARGQPPTRAR